MNRRECRREMRAKRENHHERNLDTNDYPTIKFYKELRERSSLRKGESDTLPLESVFVKVKRGKKKKKNERKGRENDLNRNEVAPVAVSLSKDSSRS